MSIVSTSIPNLINGVSQQPYALRLASQCEAQINAHSSVVEGLRKRPPLKHSAKILNEAISGAYTHIINRDATERYQVILRSGGIRVFDLNGVEKTVTTPEGTSYLIASNPEQDFYCLTVADYTFVLNKSVTVLNSGSVVPPRPFEALVWVKSPNYSTNYTVTVGATVASFTTELAGGSAANGETVRTDNIAAVLYNQLNAGGINPANGYTLERYGSVIYIAKATDFSVSAVDSQGDTAIKLVKGTVQRFTDLPAKAVPHFTVRVRGTTDTELDDYWVTYEADSSNANGGVWKEGAKPGEVNGIDGLTMPWSLVRQSDGTFTFGPTAWKPREVGDLDSNPHPSFVGKRINDIFFHRNRLGFLADENVIFSEAGEFFNFYQTSVMQLVDSDRIDVATSHTKVSLLKAAVPFSESLLLFSEQTQFALGRADLLTPKSVAINQSTEFNCDLSVKPVGVGSNVYFAQRRGSNTSIREYFVSSDTNTADATDVTSHVPTYLPKNIVKMAASSSEDMLAVLSSEDRSTVYVYRFYWSNGQKMQSAWYKWALPAGSSVLNMEFVDSDLVFLISRVDGVYIEKMNLSPADTDNLGVLVHLDRRVDETQLAVSYNAVTNVTTITKPWSFRPGEVYQIVARDGDPTQAYKPGAVVPYTDSGLTLTLPGKLTKLLLGVAYTMRYVFSTLVVREQAPGGGLQAIGDGRVQIRSMNIGYSDTGYFKALVTPRSRATYTYPFSGRILGSANNQVGKVAKETGIFRFPVVTKNDQVTIEIVNDSYLPSTFQSAEWEAFFVLRSRRI